MRLHSYINAARNILELHKPGKPLQPAMKQYFAANKKHGSRDRKIISSLCYCYFRTGKNFVEDRDEKFIRSLYVCDPKSYAATGDDRFEVHEDIALRIKDAGLDVEKIFPFPSLLSAQIDPLAFSSSMLVQPDLFLRVRPGKITSVEQELLKANILFDREGNALRILNATSLPAGIRTDRDVVVQDLESQKVFDGLPVLKDRVKVWDCCAASGGKSILLYDRLEGKCTLTATDIRPSIISNLQERFRRAGLKDFTTGVFNAVEYIPPGKQDIIICDVPCSGSGTWSRTPEQMHFFKEEQAEEYATLQRSIAKNAARALNNEGFLVYITCSVFKKENEDVVDHILQETGLKLLKQEYLPGYDLKADTLFAAVFTLA